MNEEKIPARTRIIYISVIKGYLKAA